MAQTQAPLLSEIAQVFAAALILMIPLAAAGLALMNAGLGRSRSAAHAVVGSICVVAVAALAYLVCGWSWQGYPGGQAHTVWLAGKAWNWLGAEPFLMRGVRFEGSPVALMVWLQVFTVGLVALVPLGAGNDRWRLGATCASTALLAGWTYPLFAHWLWGGGWLSQVGFLDAGGSSLQVVGGVTALAMARVLGARHGKYDAGGMPAAIPGHNAVLVLFGCFLTWIGWIGLNGSSSLLMAGGNVAGVARVALNTTLCAAAAVLAAAGLTRFRFGMPDASLCANGWTGGLVASSAACAFVSPVQAVVIGALAGLLVPLSVELLDARLGVDDPAGSIAVHAVGGLWGLLAAGMFAGSGHWLAQLAGVAALGLLVLPMTYGLNRLLNRFYVQRVSAESESHGLDLYELGAGAYPEFVTRRDDFRPR